MYHTYTYNLRPSRDKHRAGQLVRVKFAVGIAPSERLFNISFTPSSVLSSLARESVICELTTLSAQSFSNQHDVRFGVRQTPWAP